MVWYKFHIDKEMDEKSSSDKNCNVPFSRIFEIWSSRTLYKGGSVKIS